MKHCLYILGLLTLIISNNSLVLKGSGTYHSTHIIQPNDEWLIIQDQNNIKVYLKEEVLPEGHFISIKFENTSDSEVSFSWNLFQNEKIVQEHPSNFILQPKASEVFFDPTVMVQLKENETLNGFSINLKSN